MGTRAWRLPSNPLARLTLTRLTWGVVLVSGVVCVVLVTVQIVADVGVGTGSAASVLIPLGTAIAGELFVIVGVLGLFQLATARAAGAKRERVWQAKLADEFMHIGELARQHAFRALSDLVFAARNFTFDSHEWGAIQNAFDEWKELKGLHVETIDALVAAAMEIRIAVRDEYGETQEDQSARFRALQESTWSEAVLVKDFSADLGIAVSSLLVAVPDVSEDFVRGQARLSTAQAALGAALARSRLTERRLRDSESSKPTPQQTDLAALHLDPLDLHGATRHAAVELASTIADLMQALLHLRRWASGEDNLPSQGAEDRRVRELLAAGYAEVSFENSSYPYLDELLNKKAVDRGSLR